MPDFSTNPGLCGTCDFCPLPSSCSPTGVHLDTGASHGYTTGIDFHRKLPPAFRVIFGAGFDDGFLAGFNVQFGTGVAEPGGAGFQVKWCRLR